MRFSFKPLVPAVFWIAIASILAAFLACSNATNNEELGSDSGSGAPIISCKQSSVSYDDPVILYDELDPSCKDEKEN